MLRARSGADRSATPVDCLLGTRAKLKEGKAVRLCPCSSDVNLFRYGEGIIDFDAEIPDGALDLRMSQQQLHGT
jgi:hypothetical protein